MVSLGLPEIVLIMLMIVALAIPVVAVGGLIWYFCSRKNQKSDQTSGNDGRHH